MADGPGTARQGLLNSAGRKEASPPGPRHRVYLSADDEHKEALVLVSIVTEGERWEDEEDSFSSSDGAPPRTKQARATGWAAGAPASGSAAGENTRGNEHGRGVDAGHVGNLEGKTGKGGDQRERQGGVAGEQLRRRCLKKVEAAAGLGFDELRRRHVRDVEALFDRVEFSLGRSSEGDGEPMQNVGAGQGVTATPSASCVAGLPIRTRVSRSGMVCTERGEEGSDTDYSGDGGEALATNEDTESIVVDDGLIELMYHFGRWVRPAVWVWPDKQLAGHSPKQDMPQARHAQLDSNVVLFLQRCLVRKPAAISSAHRGSYGRPNVFHACNVDVDVVGGYLWGTRFRDRNCMPMLSVNFVNYCEVRTRILRRRCRRCPYAPYLRVARALLRASDAA